MHDPSPEHHLEDPHRRRCSHTQTQTHNHNHNHTCQNNNQDLRRAKPQRLLLISAFFLISSIATIRNLPHAHSLSWNSNSNTNRGRTGTGLGTGTGSTIRFVVLPSFSASQSQSQSQSYFQSQSQSQSSLFATSPTPPGAKRSPRQNNNNNNNSNYNHNNLRHRGLGRRSRINSNNDNNNNNAKNTITNTNTAASSTSPVADSRWQRAIRIETRTQIALDGLKQRSNNKRASKKTIGQLGHTEHHSEQNADADADADSPNSETVSTDQRLSSTGKNTVMIRRRNRGVLSSVPPDSPNTSTGTGTGTGTQNRTTPVSFPDIRECNFALAAFGDGGDLLRALRLYFKMRKATQMALSARTNNNNNNNNAERNTNPDTDVDIEATTLVPTPTLVTYSTLMSRAVSLGKPQVALRLWKIMRDQADFFSYVSSQGAATATGDAISSANNNSNSNSNNSNASIKASDLQNLIVPDVKAANILMNTYAKLGDLDAAEDLMVQMQTKPVLQRQTRTKTTAANGSKISNYNKGNPNPKGVTSSPHKVVFGGGVDVPYLTPNLVTYNTLLDACQKTGELQKAMHWKQVLERESERRGRGSGRTNVTYRNGKTLSVRLRPDVRTYTSLIGTVARKSSSNRQHYGTHDPSLAFSLLNEMKTKHRIAPSPLTYSALIDVCGRCRRADLALKALRLMLRDEQMQKRMKRKAERNQHQSNASGNSGSSRSSRSSRSSSKHSQPGPVPEITMDQQTVGAWTAAINACGKTGRIDTALKLFFISMPRFKVRPNVITCSCLLDSLLKQGRTAESLDVLRYMKSNNLRPSEYMYTSLMTYASRLAGLEQQQVIRTQSSRRDHRGPSHNAEWVTTTAKYGKVDDFDTTTNRPWPSLSDSNAPNQNESAREDRDRENKINPNDNEEEDDTKAVDIYSELMSTVIATTKTKQRISEPKQSKPSLDAAVAASNELYQVTLVFREMQASGVVPDLGSYNTLLRSCANSGDIDRAQEILKEIQDSTVDMEPTDRTWRAIVRAAGKAKRSDIVLKTWKSAVADIGKNLERDATEGSSGATRRKAFREASLSATNAASSKTKRKKNNLSVPTFRTFLTALLICAWDLRKSDRYTSIELYRIVIKCYNALRSSSSSTASKESSSSTETTNPPTSYMGMHLLDSNAAMQNPQIMASVLQAVVNLESLLDEDDAWKGKLKNLGVSIAKTSCLGETLRSTISEQSPKSDSASLSFFDKKALHTVRSWC